MALPNGQSPQATSKMEAKWFEENKVRYRRIKERVHARQLLNLTQLTRSVGGNRPKYCERLPKCLTPIKPFKRNTKSNYTKYENILCSIIWTFHSFFGGGEFGGMNCVAS